MKPATINWANRIIDKEKKIMETRNKKNTGGQKYGTTKRSKK